MLIDIENHLLNNPISNKFEDEELLKNTQKKIHSYLQDMNHDKHKFAFILSYIPLSNFSAFKMVILSVVKKILLASKQNEILIIMTGSYKNKKFVEPNELKMTDKESIYLLKSYFTFEEILRLSIIKIKNYNNEKPISYAYSKAIEIIKESNIGTLLLARDNIRTLYLDALLFQSFPIIDIPFNRENLLSSYSDGVLTHFDLKFKGNKYIYKCIYNLVLNKYEINYEHYNKLFKSKPSNKIKLISVIGSNRIARALEKLDKRLLNKLLNLIISNKLVSWTIVGNSNVSDYLNINPLLDKCILNNIIEIKGSIQNIQEYISRFDIYIQPPTLSGGGRVAGVNASLAKMPVVLFNKADCEARLPLLKKAPNFEDGIILLEELLNNPDLIEIKGMENYKHLLTQTNLNDTLFNDFLSKIFINKHEKFKESLK
ncbi:hypothetical protein KO488_04770 [Poseidonibacter lekithochrous]|uniref:hypothetical protein n=1 Tax=Poseidonibacter TaxID=2321187 RepID=UPI001C09C3B6|nr:MULTISPECIES: hypothetical protein [Poseidonibacter]MBU3014059.1 hypothetical protein [Poseidonibacter lekithochrous]MDO6827355.1 hypothetical protein [Poseidonibacter sp. 1_MG-2023]